MGLPEPNSPLWTAVRASGNPWPPDDEDAADQLGRGWQQGAQALHTAGTEASGAAETALGAWRDAAGSTFHGKLTGFSGTLRQLGGRMDGVTAAAGGYAGELRSVKATISSSIADNEPIYEFLGNPAFGPVGAALQQAFADQLAGMLRAYVQSRAAALRGEDSSPFEEWLKNLAGDAVRKGGEALGVAGEYVTHAVGEELAGVADYLLQGPANFVDIVGKGGELLAGLGGNIPGGVGDWLQREGTRTAQDAAQLSQDIRGVAPAIQDTFDEWGMHVDNAVENSLDSAGDGIAGEDDDKHVDIVVDRSRYPQAAQHIVDAQGGTIWRGDTATSGTPKPAELTLDRDHAALRRRLATRDYPSRGAEGLDRDEYPMALSEEGGADSSVKYIPYPDNRGAGASVGNQINNYRDPVDGTALEDGDKVRIVVR